MLIVILAHIRQGSRKTSDGVIAWIRDSTRKSPSVCARSAEDTPKSTRNATIRTTELTECNMDMTRSDATMRTTGAFRNQHGDDSLKLNGKRQNLVMPMRRCPVNNGDARNATDRFYCVHQNNKVILLQSCRNSKDHGHHKNTRKRNTVVGCTSQAHHSSRDSV